MALRSVAIALVAVFAIALVPGVPQARADDKPWAVGVLAADQAAALALYKEGNALFESSAFKDALIKYDAAITLWDHPAIRYNAAVCLINLDRTVEAYEYLESAMQFGKAPLGDLHAQGVTYQKMLAKQIGHLEVSCKQSGAKISLDGKVLIEDCPGTKARPLVVGRHQLVTEKPRYTTDTRPIEIAPGATQTLVIVLKPLPAGRVERRWKKWKPWAVIAGGGVAALIGGLVYFKADGTFTDYDAQVSAHWDKTGMELPQNIIDVGKRAKLERAIAYSAIALGATGVAVGFALVVANQPRLVKSPIRPMVGTDHVGAVLSGSW